MAKEEVQDGADTAGADKVSVKAVRVRILSGIEINGVKISCNRVAVVDDVTAASLVSGGVADDHPSAVDYALSENPEVIDTTV